MSIAVFGSINMDVTAYMHRLPKPGETLQGKEYKLGLGGKGANQAVAARKLGSEVDFICRLGSDDFAKPAERELASYGVDLSLAAKDEGGATGIAIINVGEGGENYISLIGGSNLRLDATEPHELLIADPHLVSQRTQMLFNQVSREAIVSCGYRCVCCK